MTMKTVLTVAGSDCSGGAGIQADLKTMTAFGVYGMSAVTALTAQNTLGVTAVSEVTPEFLGEQLDRVFEDIFPDAVKTGMLPSGALIAKTAEKLSFYGAKNIVVDPVMVSTSGSELMQKEAVSALREKLFPLAFLVTPNIPEAETLTGAEIRSEQDMEAAAKRIFESFGCAVLLKGGHRVCDADDLLWTSAGAEWFRGKRIDNPNTHGTGCTLSSAIASCLAKGFSPQDAVRKSKRYLSGALAAMLDLGKGDGPLFHGFAIRNDFTDED